jgi:glycosyltransferase involved in cell wall biosynthesis
MNVLLLSRYGRLGASSRLRSYQYLPFLKDHGINVTVSALLGDWYIEELYGGRRAPSTYILRAYIYRLLDLLRAKQFDVLWIEAELFPWLPAWVERILIGLGVPCVVDYNDAIYHRYELHSNPVIRRILGRKIDSIMGRVSLVIVGNRYLAWRAKQAGATWVECIPTVVDLARYERKTEQQSDRFTIGWIGSPTTAQYLQVSSGLTNAALRRCPHCACWSRSGRPQGWNLTSERGQRTRVADIRVSTWELCHCRTAHLSGKVRYKFQYMACSLP